MRKFCFPITCKASLVGKKDLVSQYFVLFYVSRWNKSPIGGVGEE